MEFEESISSEDGADLLREKVDGGAALPDNAKVSYRTINAGAIDGEHELIFNVSGPDDYQELERIATTIADEVAAEPAVANAEFIELEQEQINPLTGQTIQRREGFSRVGYRDGDEFVFDSAVAVGVTKKPNQGVVDLSDAVRRQVDELRESGDLEGVTVTYGGDLSENVLEQRSSLEQNALIGLISVVILIFLLIDWRASIVGGLFIPVVFGGVFVALYAIGYSLNVISLFSLVLVLGMFVDNATVVVDAIERAKARGLKGREAISGAIGEIGTSIIAGTWTTILVFLPMAFITGVLGKFIILIPVTVILALLISLVLALSVTPWLSNMFIRDKHAPGKHSGSFMAMSRLLNAPSRGVGALSKIVTRFVHGYLSKRWKVFAVIVVTFGLIGFGGSYAQKLNFSVFPPAKDGDQLVVTLDYPAGTSVAQAEQIAADFEPIMLDEAGDDLEGVTYYIADDSQAFIIVDLSEVGSRERTSPEITEALQGAADDFEAARVTVKAQTAGPPQDEYQLTVRVLGTSLEQLETGTQDVQDFLTGRELSDGESVTEVLVERFDVLTKVDGQRFAQVKAKISDPQKTNLVLELQDALDVEYTPDRLDQLGLAQDAVSVDLGQEGENVESFESAAVALLIALIIMYALLVAQFNSFTQPVLIFLAIPFSFVVLFPALFITENDLSFFVMLGIIALAGVVVNNTIMLVHQANLLRAEGKTASEAISVAVGIRFRALLATSLTTIAGLLPLALSDPFWEPLAFTIIFGLASSVVLAALSFPAFYVVVEGIRDVKKRFRPKTQG